MSVGFEQSARDGTSETKAIIQYGKSEQIYTGVKQKSKGYGKQARQPIVQATEERSESTYTRTHNLLRF